MKGIDKDRDPEETDTLSHPELDISNKKGKPIATEAKKNVDRNI
mgnify:CR=1 FL=1